jgi:adenylate kinase family enzyme
MNERPLIGLDSRRIHVTGASGSGVTSLGRALAHSLALPHHDTDDYLWKPTTPPYRELRDVADRLRLMREMFLPRVDWVLSGGLEGWGNELVPHFDLVVFLKTARDLRLQRLRAREAVHFGTEAVGPGGWRHEQTEAFIEWASHYENGSREGRSLARHESWLARLPCPVLRLDGSRPLSELVVEVRRAIDG